jgi:hypothetical protein
MAAPTSGKGFSADLAKEMGGPAAQTAAPQVASSPRGTGRGTGDAKAGEGNANDAAKAGEAMKKSDATQPGDAKADDAAKAGEAPKKGDRPADATRPGDARAGDVNPRNVALVTPPVGPDAKPATSTPPVRAPAARGPVRVPADVAAIKLSLLPNWDRDIGEPGTFQYVVRIKGTESTKTFSFRYGYDDPRAPVDRDEYKKYLQEASLLTGEIRDRQRGSAWLLEGNDASGLPAFRYVVLYGGKRLICYGSMYRDAESNPLGDDRDQTVIQAKQICESLSL